MKKLAIILFAFWSAYTQAQSLDDYLKMAADSNSSLQSSYHEFEAAMQKIPQVKSLPDPSISVSTFGQMIETRVGPQRAIFIFNQMFPWFGTLKAQGNAMTLMAESKFQVWLDARNEVFYQLKSSWYLLYELEQIINYQKENKIILETYKTLSVIRFKNGSGTMVDVIRVDIMMNDIITELKVLEDKRKPLLAQFNKVVNRKMDSPVVIVDTPVPDTQSIAFSTDSILQNNPKLTELDKKIQAWKIQGLVARKQGMPKIGVGLNYTIIGKRTDMDVPGNGKDAIMPMVSMSLPIYRRKYRAAVKESDLMQTSLQEMKQEMSNGLIVTFDMTYYELQKSIEEYQLFAAQMEKTKQAINLLLTAYSNSGKDFEEVLRMQQILLKYQIATATATKNYYTAIAKLDYLTAKK